jgi:hypothetical protein
MEIILTQAEIEGIVKEYLEENLNVTVDRISIIIDPYDDVEISVTPLSVEAKNKLQAYPEGSITRGVDGN